MMRLISILCALVSVASLPAARAQDGLSGRQSDASGLSLQRVAERQQNPARAELDRAIRTLKNGGYERAAMALYDFLRTKRVFRDEARYNLAKALYRMGVYRSALYDFTRLLARGPKNRFYRSSLEWCLFISRKMDDDQTVNAVVARYGGDQFPPAYRDEFLFRLARYHFDRALAIERGEVSRRSASLKVEERPTGGKSIKGDLFSDPVTDPGAPPPPPPPAPPPPTASGGISVDDDLFSDTPPPKPAPVKPAPPKPPPPSKKTRSGRKKRKRMTAEQHTARAQQLVVQVDPKSRFGPRAKFLEGVLLYKTGEANAALERFKDVVRATRQEGRPADPGLRQMAFFQLARTHFGAEQPSFSIFYYDKINRDTYAWLDALYEGSWAEFRLGNYEKALGNLLTLHAPFFTDTYYPESLILKAVVYYENCRYPEAKEILQDFLKRYEPVHDELTRMTSKSQSYEAYYQALETLRSNTRADRAESSILTQVLDIALSDPELERLDRAVREVDDEIRRVDRTTAPFQDSRLHKRLTKLLTRSRTLVSRMAGRAVKNQLERERDTINQLIKQAIRIDIETARSEQERIESQLRAVQRRPKRVDKTFVEWTDDEKLVWPFEGEYWSDELGTYELTLAHSCR